MSASRCEIAGVGGGSAAAGSGVTWVPMAGSAGSGAAGRAGRCDLGVAAVGCGKACGSAGRLLPTAAWRETSAAAGRAVEFQAVLGPWMDVAWGPVVGGAVKASAGRVLPLPTPLAP